MTCSFPWRCRKGEWPVVNSLKYRSQRHRRTIIRPPRVNWFQWWMRQGHHQRNLPSFTKRRWNDQMVPWKSLPKRRMPMAPERTTLDVGRRNCVVVLMSAARPSGGYVLFSKQMQWLQTSVDRRNSFSHFLCLICAPKTIPFVCISCPFVSDFCLYRWDVVVNPSCLVKSCSAWDITFVVLLEQQNRKVLASLWRLSGSFLSPLALPSPPLPMRVRSVSCTFFYDDNNWDGSKTDETFNLPFLPFLPFWPFSTIKRLALYPFVIYFIVAATRTRMQMRRKYRIPPSCCGESCWDDCCCVYWCSCCVAIQMHRHTHNTQEYPYSCGSKTGTYSVSLFLVFHFVSFRQPLLPALLSLTSAVVSMNFVSGLPDNAPVIAESETIPVTEHWKTNCPDVVWMNRARNYVQMTWNNRGNNMIQTAEGTALEL